MKKRILFVCTHNLARSQMAEGLLRDLGGDQFEAFSAGTEATHVRPFAIKAMAERVRLSKGGNSGSDITTR
jgi:arsenate reductase (thioredoxin)